MSDNENESAHAAPSVGNKETSADYRSQRDLSATRDREARVYLAATSSFLLFLGPCSIRWD